MFHLESAAANQDGEGQLVMWTSAHSTNSATSAQSRWAVDGVRGRRHAWQGQVTGLSNSSAGRGGITIVSELLLISRSLLPVQIS